MLCHSIHSRRIDHVWYHLASYHSFDQYLFGLPMKILFLGLM
jgi:hypothetical protein